jgi:hypothetical protein
MCAPLQILHHIVLSRYHTHSGKQQDFIVPLKIFPDMVIKIQTITTFHNICSGEPTDATATIA